MRFHPASGVSQLGGAHKREAFHLVVAVHVARTIGPRSVTVTRNEEKRLLETADQGIVLGNGWHTPGHAGYWAAQSMNAMPIFSARRYARRVKNKAIAVMRDFKDLRIKHAYVQGSPPLYDTVGRPRSSMVESQNMSRLSMNVLSTSPISE